MTIIIIIGIVILYILLHYIIERIKQRIKDKAAKNILENFDFQKEKEEILDMTNPFIKEEYKCPKCKRILKLRHGRFGQFWGCSNYPQCTFTKNNIYKYGIL